MNNRLKSFLLFVTAITVMYCCGGCSSEYHYKRIMKKDPTFFKVDTTIYKLDAPVIQTDINCIDLLRSGVPKFITIPRTYLDESGKKKTDSVILRFIPVDSSMIRAEVECPDPEVKYLPEPYPVYVNPTMKERIQIAITGAGLALVIWFVGSIVWRLLKK